MKLFFGGIIFLFAVALAYTTANYFYTEAGPTHSSVYWFTLMIAGVIYILLGVVVSSVFPVSLGFLFSADVLILHTLGAKYGEIPDPAKTALVAIVLIILYVFAWKKLGDNQSSISAAPENVSQIAQ
jgi:hypothetical protein